MAKLIYVTNVSLDGFIEDEHGDFGWTEPDDGYFAFVTDLVRPIGTFIYGRRLYESMAVWETEPALAAQSELNAEFARVWQAPDKIVYSTTLDAVSTGKTRLEREFDPDSIRTMKATASRDLMVGGANIAAHTFAARADRRMPPLHRPRRRRSRQPGLPSGCAPSSSCSTSAGSTTASCTSAIASWAEPADARAEERRSFRTSVSRSVRVRAVRSAPAATCRSRDRMRPDPTRRRTARRDRTTARRRTVAGVGVAAEVRGSSAGPGSPGARGSCCTRRSDVRLDDRGRDRRMVRNAHSLADVVQQRREHDLFVGAGPLGQRRGLQRVRELVDGEPVGDRRRATAAWRARSRRPGPGARTSPCR